MNEQETSLAVVVLAGYSPNEQDLLADYTFGRSKALIPIAGRPMISYVMDALAGSRYVRNIVVVGLPEEERPALTVPASYLPNYGGMLANAEAALRYAVSLEPPVKGVLICGADLPLLTPAAVDRFAETCLETEHDLYYGVVERSVMESRFPTSRRTYIRLVEGEFAGGDLILVRAGATIADRELWERLSNARKSPIRQVLLAGGIWPMVKLLTRRMSIPEAERLGTRALGLLGRVVICADPELGMDVDKPFQLEIARTELEARGSGAAN